MMNSFISWIGGKKLLRNKILEVFPEQGTFNRYIEVFGVLDGCCFRLTDTLRWRFTMM